MSLLNNTTLVLLISHIFGDFQFQSQDLSNMKTKSLKAVVKHLLVHALVMIVIAIIAFGWHGLLTLFPLILTIWISHGILDIAKFYLNHVNRISQETLYITDQLLHIFLIIIFSEFVFTSNITLNFTNRDILEWVLLLLVVTKPANVTFKTVFQRFQFQPDTVTVPGAGAIIGNLERILSAIFLSMNQIAAIGFIYTAKSIARFKEIEDNKRFAEYYLIGTLFSILYVIVAYFVIVVM